MSLADIVLLLKQDLAQTFRLGAVGKRSEQKSTLRRFLPIILVAIFWVALTWGLTVFIPLIGWSVIADLIAANLGIGATLFNALLLFSFIGSIMVSATTVGNSKRMEYLMTMPIALRTLFLEKTLVIIFYNAMLWLIIGFPIFLGLSIVSGSFIAFLSVPVFLLMQLVLSTLGVSTGGLIGLGISRLVAGRRTLKQVGYFFFSTIAIIFSVFYYYAIYSSDGGELFTWLFEIAETLGFSSGFSPGYAASALALGILVQAPLGIQYFLLALFYALLAGGLVYVNSYVSEVAHYSGWLASGSKRTSKEDVKIEHEVWDPKSIPGIKMSQTASVSAWYNITSVRREGRVFAQYLVGPLRFVIFLILPVFVTDFAFGFSSYLIIAALIPFAVQYGVYFGGYETVYEGKNLMNLQLAATNMQEYVKGKVLSALPFTIGASLVVSVLVLFVGIALWPLLPAVFFSAIFINMAAGSVAANAAAEGGDFKAERMIQRQRGSAVQPPIRMWSALKATLLPNVIGFGGVFGMIGIAFITGAMYGELFGYLAAYVFLPVFCAICYQLYRRYTYLAGVRLAQVEASDYL